jgi:hypothetical protein
MCSHKSAAQLRVSQPDLFMKSWSLNNSSIIVENVLTEFKLVLESGVVEKF